MSFAITAETAFRFWAQLDCPTSLKLYLLGKADQWAEVITAKVSPEHFNDPLEYARANAAVCFLKKCPDVPSSSSAARRKACDDSWVAAEASCFRTNERLSYMCVSPLSGDTPSEFLRRVRRTLISWLGFGPTDESLKDKARHGPGTTFSSAAVFPTAADKYDEPMTLTPGCVWHLPNVIGTLWSAEQIRKCYPRAFYQVVRGNRFTTVPKTALTDRGISIEGSLNIYFQLSVGREIRDQLHRRTGWDLNVAADIHRKMACRGSVDGSFATLDLTNASDTLCKNLVRILLRQTRWLSVMEDLRSSHTFRNGAWHLLEKFSSMGNGYTFELETCIFAAIASECLKLKGHSGVLGRDLFVFGDDIIIPSDCNDLVTKTLRYCGFEANPSKSFASGSFRESCGGDYFLGESVRGFYLKGAISFGTQRVFSVHNGVKSVLERCGVDPAPFCEWIREALLPEGLRHLGGSERLGDSVLWGVPPVFKWRHGIRWVRTMRWQIPKVVPWSFFSIASRLACRLTGHGDTFGIFSRGGYLRPSTAWTSDS
jgi:hypothetical protein